MRSLMQRIDSFRCTDKGIGAHEWSAPELLKAVYRTFVEKSFIFYFPIRIFNLEWYFQVFLWNTQSATLKHVFTQWDFFTFSVLASLPFFAWKNTVKIFWNRSTAIKFESQFLLFFISQPTDVRYFKKTELFCFDWGFLSFVKLKKKL